MDTTPPTPPRPPTPPTSPSIKRDACWSCGYDLTNLDSSICPECGAHFPTGKDLQTLHDRLLGGASRRCIKCGAPRTQAGITRCPTCGLRYSRDPEEAPSAGVPGGVSAQAARRGPRLELPPRDPRSTFGHLMFPIGMGITVSVLLGVFSLSIHFEDSLPEWAPSIIRAVVVVLCLMLVATIVFRAVRRDVLARRAHAARNSSRRSQCCPRCSYDTSGLPQPKCPECGCDLPFEQGA